ncbi:hypothetical protein [Litorimonas sp. WD9-15]|uniref:hypothetical protein n=1 Tax=Litorimonas sp. WD9-15 TaxID=3418716 RepID=UPI003CFC8A2D
MTLRDISVWGFFKLILVIEYLIAIITAPFLLLAAFFIADGKPNVTIDKDIEMKALGITYDFGELNLIPALIIAFFWYFIMLLIKSRLLVFICKFTPIGKIDVGKYKYSVVGE